MSFGDRPDWKRRALDSERHVNVVVQRLSECAVSTVAITPAEAERLIRDLGFDAQEIALLSHGTDIA